MCGGDHCRNARIAAEEGTAIIEESRLEELRQRMRKALENDKSHVERLSAN